jgi:hypothetical protein
MRLDVTLLEMLLFRIARMVGLGNGEEEEER